MSDQILPLVVYLGANLAISKGNRWIKRVFEVVTVLVGIKLVFG